MDYTSSPEFLGLQAAVAGRYSLDAEIGRGGMGIVYRAMDVTLDRVVAIKLLPPAYADRPAIRDRFLQEARTAARLSHPNIAPIFSVEEADGFVFFVMAHVEGLTLAERVAQTGPLLPHDAVPIFREVAWALGYAHAQGLVHRDVKPDNVMLEAGTGRALVLDFGIAGAETETTDEVLGTPHFMSPEQATGEPTGPTSDIYSLGATMFFALAGRPPFRGSAAPEIVAHHIRTPAPRMSETAPGTPGKLSVIVDQCLAKETADRPSRAEDIAERLGSAIQARKEIPVPVRAFITRAKQRPRSGASLIFGVYIVGGPLIGLGFLLGASLGSGAALFYTIGIGSLLLAVSVAVSAHRARRLLHGGYERADLVRGFEDDYRQRLEELPFIYGEQNDRVVSRMRRFSNLGFGLGVPLMLAGAVAPMAFPWGLLAGMIGVGLRVASSRRSAGVEKSRVKFWKGRIGKWLFKLGGWRLKRSTDQPRLTHRPTEMALGLSVLGLFEALPRPTQQSLGDLPAVVAGLEHDAQRMRERVREMDEVLVGAAADDHGAAIGDDSLTGQRARAVRSVRRVRDQAAQRLADAVAALETLRVDLLRIRAGDVSLEHVTENLGAARDVSVQVERLLVARDQIDQAVLR